MVITMKKNNCLILVIVMICSIFINVNAYSAGLKDVVVSLQIDNPILEYNGTKYSIDDNNTTPIEKNGRTLVPIRSVIEAFGGDVSWNGDTRTATLKMDGDTVSLTIGSNTGYLNGVGQYLDVAPEIINGRTMLPIRFVAESFNLGVAWEGDTRTVTILRNGLDDEEYQYIKSVVPQYGGWPYFTVNNNVPMFKDYEIIGGSFEYYSKLDNLGRCDVTMASIAEDIMPTEKRGDISSVTPTGWQNKSYDFIPGKYLYNRCHLIGYQLTGENANPRNLITGTRALNVDGMLPFENAVDDYIERTGNHVMYRVTPVFDGSNLVADGVLMEAYSVEDNGQGVMFCVYCYNSQPDIYIDYATGANSSSVSQTVTYTPTDTPSQPSGVYRTASGKRYHFDAQCGGKNSYAITLEQAKAAGLTPCQKCAK